MEGLAGIWWRLWRAGRNTTYRFTVLEPARGVALITVVGTVSILIAGLVKGMIAYLRGNERYAALTDSLRDNLLALFFFGLFFLVGMSTTLVTWSALFRTRTAHFQAQLPLANRALFWGAAIEGGLWAGWAMMVLGLPILYGLMDESMQPGLAFAAGTLSLFGFLACCMGLGGLGAVVLARLIPVLRRGLRGLLLGAALVLCAGIGTMMANLDQQQNRYDYLNEVFSRIGFIHNDFLPSLWTQRSISAALSSYWSEWIYYIGLSYLTAAVLFMLGEHIAHNRLRIDMDLLTGRPEDSRKPRSRVWTLFPFLPKDIGLLVAKDLRLFIRDPAQILQFLLFFGMLGFYIILLPRIGKAFMNQDWWSQTVSLLNLLAVSMALATFTGRFVYPLLSLEGKRLWVLKLAPWPAHRVVTAKFAFALIVGAPISILLVSLSGIMLELSLPLIAYQALITLCMAFGLAAAALGLGARLADYNEDNPAKLVAGYGGTVNLLASLFYTAVILVGAAIPMLIADPTTGWTVGLSWSLVITWAWSVGFMRLARRSFAERAGQA